MERSTIEIFSLLIDSIGSMSEVQSIGKSGGSEFPSSNESDVDIFVFCTKIPSPENRQSKVAVLGDAIGDIKISTYEGKHWGVCDFIQIHETEICLMYFTVDKINAEIESVLNGERLEKEDNYFYPTGRCATLLSMHILFEKQNFIASMKEKLSVYPGDLSEKLLAHHMRRLNDVEDLERAVSRKDVLFYHFALDLIIDHFLQALFALNKCFFPSRKRTLLFINEFQTRPENCGERLVQVIELGGKGDTLKQSYDLWTCLCRDLANLSGS